MAQECERWFILNSEACNRDLREITSYVLMEENYFPPIHEGDPWLRIRCETPGNSVSLPRHQFLQYKNQNQRCVGCIKIATIDADTKNELEWELPVALISAIRNCQPCSTQKLRIPGDLYWKSIPKSLQVTLDLWLDPSGYVYLPFRVKAEVEGEPSDVRSFVPPSGWKEVTGNKAWSSHGIALHGWPDA